MTLAVLGGSFNPVHIGHLALADAVCAEFGYDKVLFVPTAEPPHKKPAADFASAADRLAMLRLAVAGNPRFEVSDAEIARGGISYTYDTLEEFSEKYRGELSARIGLIMGSDLLSGFHLWQNADKIAENADLILASRWRDFSFSSVSENSVNKPLGEYGALCELNDDEQEKLRLDFPYPHKLLRASILPVSSTVLPALRARVGDTLSQTQFIGIL